MTPMTLPGFTAEASLGPPRGLHRWQSSIARQNAGARGVAAQFASRTMSGVDLGAYWRCRANGGSDLVCRFFGGLPPFTIGGLLF